MALISAEGNHRDTGTQRSTEKKFENRNGKSERKKGLTEDSGQLTGIREEDVSLLSGERRHFVEKVLKELVVGCIQENTRERNSFFTSAWAKRPP